MNRPGAVSPGMTKDDLSTPALIIDLDLMESNICRMSEYVKAAGLKLRPHGKSHKCPEIARLQAKAGAVGVCAATIREAEALAAAGIGGLLITAEMVGRDKIARLVRLTRKLPDTMSVVDHPAHADELSQAAQAAGVTLNILVDIDPQLRRTGIPAGEGAVALAEKIARLPHLNLRGLQCYSADTSHVEGFEARRAHSEERMIPAIETFQRLQKLGLPVDIMSGGSTGTYNIDSALKGMTELQCGSYLLMDVDYWRIGGRGSERYVDFAQALSVLATVISRSHSGFATVDAGYKAFATDRAFGPALKGIEGVRYRFGGDEHGILELQNPSREIRLGDRLEFIVPHCDPNVNLYDWVYGFRGDRVEAIWSIARGY